MKVLFLFFLTSLAISNNKKQKSVWSPACYKIKDRDGETVIFSTFTENPLPKSLTLSKITKTKSKKNNETLKTVENIYQIEIKAGKCNKSLALSGHTTKNVYLKYEFALSMVNSDLILNRFAMDVYFADKYFKEKMVGEFERVVLHVDYTPLNQESNEVDSFDEATGNPIGKLKKQGICLQIQYEKLWMSFPLRRLSHKNALLAHRTTEIEFEYIANKTNKYETIYVKYNAWVHSCSTSGSRLKFDLVVRNKVDNSQITIRFLDWSGIEIGFAKVTYPGYNKLLVFAETTVMNMEVNLMALNKALQAPKNTHIYLDNFEKKITRCENNREMLYTYVVRQFGKDRYHTHLFPIQSMITSGVVVWSPLKQQEFD